MACSRAPRGGAAYFPKQFRPALRTAREDAHPLLRTSQPVRTSRSAAARTPMVSSLLRIGLAMKPDSRGRPVRVAVNVDDEACSIDAVRSASAPFHHSGGLLQKRDAERIDRHGGERAPPVAHQKRNGPHQDLVRQRSRSVSTRSTVRWHRATPAPKPVLERKSPSRTLGRHPLIGQLRCRTYAPR